MTEPMSHERPWMVAAARLDADTRKARLIAIFLDPEDRPGPGPFDIEDYVHVESSFDASPSAPRALLLKAACASGACAAKLLGEDEIRIWPGLYKDPPDLSELHPDENCSTRLVPSEPDGDLKAAMAGIRDGLEKYLAADP